MYDQCTHMLTFTSVPPPPPPPGTLTLPPGTCLQKLAESDQRSQELADFNAVLAGHANHHQKLMYMKKIQTDYNAIKEVGFAVTSVTVLLPASDDSSSCVQQFVIVIMQFLPVHIYIHTHTHSPMIHEFTGPCVAAFVCKRRGRDRTSVCHALIQCK